MIEVGTGGFDRLAKRLLARAKALAEARALARRGERRGDFGRWRSARLLWPGFGKE